MTQLSLFESPVSVATPVATPVTTPVAPVTPVTPSTMPRRRSAFRGENVGDADVDASRRAVASASAEDLERADLGHREGLNKMGDLARLVILRYELAAKRRHETLARRNASLGS